MNEPESISQGRILRKLVKYLELKITEPNHEGYRLSLRMLKEGESLFSQKYDVPSLIKEKIEGEEVFWLYGLSKEGKPKLKALKISPVFKNLEFNENQFIYVSPHENEKIYQEVEAHKAHFNYDLNILEDRIKSLQGDGHCSGFTTVWLFAKFLEAQPIQYDEKGNAIERDDTTWFFKTLHTIQRWKGEKLNEFSSQDIKDIERLISLIEFFQNITTHLFADHSQQQGQLNLSLEETRSRMLKKEYSLVSLLMPQQLEVVLKEIIFEDKLVLLGSSNHAIGLYKKNGRYYVYNSSSEDGEEVCFSDEAQVANYLFEGFKFNKQEYSPFIFKIFSFDQKPENYIKQEILLAKIKAVYSAGKYNALNLALVEGDQECINYYIHQQGNNLNLPDKEGKTPLQMAMLYNRDEATKLLISKGVDLNVSNELGYTPLHIAMMENKEDLFKFLLEHGANPNIPDKDGKTLLYFAFIEDKKEMIKLLLKHGANPNVHDKNGDTLLHSAVKYDKEEIAGLLIESGADINIPRKDKYRLFYSAIKKDKKEVVKRLIKSGVNINRPDKNGNTPLCIALNNNKEEMAKFLIDNGADTKVLDKEGNTLLHVVIANNNKTLLEMLVRDKANFNVPNNDKVTPWDLFAGSNKDDVLVDVLISSGTEEQKVYALLIAAENYNFYAFKKLLQSGVLLPHEKDSMLLPLISSLFIQNNEIRQKMIKIMHEIDKIIEDKKPLNIKRKKLERDFLEKLIIAPREEKESLFKEYEDKIKLESENSHTSFFKATNDFEEVLNEIFKNDNPAADNVNSLKS